MVKRRKNNTQKKRSGKGFKENSTEARRINASTIFEFFARITHLNQIVTPRLD